MIKILKLIGARVYKRYETLEKNIKSGSNSFYDSFLNLQEEMVRCLCFSNGIELESHQSCGAILKRTDVKALFVDAMGLDPLEYNKMGDYVLKANKHKHNKEKQIEQPTVINYVYLIYCICRAFAKSKELEIDEFDDSCYISMFRQYEKEYIAKKEIFSRLKATVQRLIESGRLDEEQVEMCREFLTDTDDTGLPIDIQNEQLQMRIDNITRLFKSVGDISKTQEEIKIKIDDIEERFSEFEKETEKSKRAISSSHTSSPKVVENVAQFSARAEQKHIWGFTYESYKKSKITVISFLILNMIIQVLATAMSTKAIGIYSTFTFLENLWVIFQITMLKQMIKARRRYSSIELAFETPYKESRNQFGILAFDDPKMKYIAFMVICCIGCGLNILYFWIEDIQLVYAIIATIIELAMAATTIASYWLVTGFFSEYYFAELTGYSIDGKETITYIYNGIYGTVLPLEEFKEQYENVEL